MKSKAVIFLLGGMFLTACGYELPKAGNTADTSTNSSVLINQNTNTQASNLNNLPQANINAGAVNSKSGGDTGEAKLVLIGSGEPTTYPCNGREVEIEESATAVSYTFTGECKKITVDGVSVTVNVEKVGEIVVKGVSNKVVYGEGIGGKKPKITKSGTSTFVETKAEAEKRKSETN